MKKEQIYNVYYLSYNLLCDFQNQKSYCLNTRDYNKKHIYSFKNIANENKKQKTKSFYW